MRGTGLHFILKCTQCVAMIYINIFKQRANVIKQTTWHTSFGREKGLACDATVNSYCDANKSERKATQILLHLGNIVCSCYTFHTNTEN